MKDETYPEYKHARAINSRSDEFKCLVGPLQQLCNDKLFERPEFIKKVPVHLRPDKMMQDLYLVGESIRSTDYSAFEATFVKRLMKVSNWFQRYLTKELPDGGWWADIIEEAEQGDNFCRFKEFIISVEAKRMSGEMDTSFSNGFMNWMFVTFWAKKTGNRVTTEIEGDDGNPLFTPLQVGTRTSPPTREHFAQLGAEIKIEASAVLEESSFCGQVFDNEERLNVMDPREVLATFAYTSVRYVKAGLNKKKTLLRCKSLSLAYQYPGCPIISALARYGLRVTRSMDVRHTIENWQNMWEREQMLEALKHPILDIEVGERTRMLVDKLFHISPEIQRNIESYLDSKNDMLPLSLTDLTIIMPVVWGDYFDRYASDSDTEFPAQFWNVCAAYSKTVPFRMAPMGVSRKVKGD